jgi:hypothetical protein
LEGKRVVTYVHPDSTQGRFYHDWRQRARFTMILVLFAAALAGCAGAPSTPAKAVPEGGQSQNVKEPAPWAGIRPAIAAPPTTGGQVATRWTEGLGRNSYGSNSAVATASTLVVSTSGLVTGFALGSGAQTWQVGIGTQSDEPPTLDLLLIDKTVYLAGTTSHYPNSFAGRTIPADTAFVLALDAESGQVLTAAPAPGSNHDGVSGARAVAASQSQVVFVDREGAVIFYDLAQGLISSVWYGWSAKPSCLSGGDFAAFYAPPSKYRLSGPGPFTQKTLPTGKPLGWVNCVPEGPNPEASATPDSLLMLMGSDLKVQKSLTMSGHVASMTCDLKTCLAAASPAGGATTLQMLAQDSLKPLNEPAPAAGLADDSSGEYGLVGTDRWVVALKNGVAAWGESGKQLWHVNKLEAKLALASRGVVSVVGRVYLDAQGEVGILNAASGAPLPPSAVATKSENGIRQLPDGSLAVLSDTGVQIITPSDVALKAPAPNEWGSHGEIFQITGSGAYALIYPSGSPEVVSVSLLVPAN